MKKDGTNLKSVSPSSILKVSINENLVEENQIFEEDPNYNEDEDSGKSQKLSQSRRLQYLSESSLFLFHRDCWLRQKLLLLFLTPNDEVP